MKKILVIIPAYNEEENIGELLDRLEAYEKRDLFDILVIDDGSKDRTAEIVREKGILVLSQIFNMGYGVALQTAYKYAVNNNYEYLFQIDADGQHDVKNIGRMIEECGCLKNDRTECPDILIGSRFLEGSETFYMSRLKMFAIVFFRKVIKKNTGVKLSDPTSGLQALNREAFSYYAKYGNFDLTYPDMNMIVQMLLLGYKIKEFPAIMHERTAGVSMHTGIFKVGKYMILMSLSTWNAYARHRKSERMKGRYGNDA